MSRPGRTFVKRARAGARRGTWPRRKQRRAKRRPRSRRRSITRLPAAVRDFVRGRVIEFTDGNRLDLFDNGKEGLAQMLDEIRRAHDSVHLETYILRTDTTGRRFLAALEERARAGVQVRLIYDAIGSHALDPRALVPLRRAGGQANTFNTLGKSIRSRIIRRRDHRKLLVVDGRIGFVGGLNIGDEYAAEVEGEPSWRDAHARVEGPVVRELERRFSETWARCEAKSDAEDEVSSDHVTRLLSSDGEQTAGTTRAAVLADGPIYRRRRMRDTVISGLDDAQFSVLLVSPYFAPGHRVLDALANAAKRGVRVEVLMAGRSDHPIFRHAARAFVPRLLHCGVRVFEDAVRMMHAKVAVFDDQLSIIGTSNLDRQSLYHSYEIGLLVEGSATAHWVREHFGPEPTGALPIDLDSLARRGWMVRLIDRMAWSLIRLI